jgi:hypothetical protein
MPKYSTPQAIRARPVRGPRTPVSSQDPARFCFAQVPVRHVWARSLQRQKAGKRRLRVGGHAGIWKSIEPWSDAGFTDWGKAEQIPAARSKRKAGGSSHEAWRRGLSRSDSRIAASVGALATMSEKTIGRLD